MDTEEETVTVTFSQKYHASKDGSCESDDDKVDKVALVYTNEDGEEVCEEVDDMCYGDGVTLELKCKSDLAMNGEFAGPVVYM
jgi:hypothetical protein